MTGPRLRGSAHLRDLWAREEPAFGLWRMLVDPITAELCSAADFDYSVVDTQHGFGSLDDLPQVLQAARAGGAKPLVRTPWRDAWMIMRAIDSGASGVLVPMVNTAQQAAETVAACKFPPAGERSWGPMWGDVREDAAPLPNIANSDIACIVMVETQQGVDNLDEIVQVPGIDAIYVGPNDLALSCGFGRDTYDTNPEVDALIQGIVDTCIDAGIPAGVHCSSVEMALDWVDRGALMLTTATDTGLLKDGAAAVLRQVRG